MRFSTILCEFDEESNINTNGQIGTVIKITSSLGWLRARKYILHKTRILIQRFNQHRKKENCFFKAIRKRSRRRQKREGIFLKRSIYYFNEAESFSLSGIRNLMFARIRRFAFLLGIHSLDIIQAPQLANEPALTPRDVWWSPACTRLIQSKSQKNMCARGIPASQLLVRECRWKKRPRARNITNILPGRSRFLNAMNILITWMRRFSLRRAAQYGTGAIAGRKTDGARLRDEPPALLGSGETAQRANALAGAGQERAENSAIRWQESAHKQINELARLVLRFKSGATAGWG